MSSYQPNDTTLSTSRKPRMALMRLLDSLPLAAFLTYLALARPQRPDAWLLPYALAAVLAALALAASQLTRRIHNRIHVGLACYFISGAAALLFGWQAINQWYGAVEAAAMLSWVAVVGVVTTAVSRYGFIGVDAISRGAAVRASLKLLAVALSAAAMSFAFVGDGMLWHAYLPFSALFVVQAALRARL